ncbi:hydrogenase maturation peptidase HycI [Uliginosibacterium sp. 31-16]|uniref:hydrogenase maturation peptidase HycI n=1 Tax=Uliginosibacterium sp. 31-16 TaxID=3068315 RepID=UPI00273E594A|nr:hydrogenase maturation peptidase HycI [Uliginosibacterium sp. 31-16]MDP5240892.1 hydrogenase maturation peptidase HycI [Uliginosibacterium sp. 31-16]
MSGVILTVGNSMMGDDGAGPLLADLLTKTPASGWSVIDGGSAPENVAHEVQALKPQRVLVVDAADFAEAPGTVRLIDDAAIADMFIMTTHNLPLSFLIERLRETIPEVLFLGIQPDLVAFGFPMGSAVRSAVEALHTGLCAGEDPATYPWLQIPA